MLIMLIGDFHLKLHAHVTEADVAYMTEQALGRDDAAGLPDDEPPR